MLRALLVLAVLAEGASDDGRPLCDHLEALCRPGECLVRSNGCDDFECGPCSHPFVDLGVGAAPVLTSSLLALDAAAVLALIGLEGAMARRQRLGLIAASLLGGGIGFAAILCVVSSSKVDAVFIAVAPLAGWAIASAIAIAAYLRAARWSVSGRAIAAAAVAGALPMSLAVLAVFAVVAAVFGQLERA